jgi:hypothetical protein
VQLRNLKMCYELPLLLWSRSVERPEIGTQTRKTPKLTTWEEERKEKKNIFNLPFDESHFLPVVELIITASAPRKVDMEWKPTHRTLLIHLLILLNTTLTCIARYLPPPTRALVRLVRVV